MTSEELAEFIVEEFNAIEAPLIAFKAVKPEGPPEVDAEQPDFVVYVWPFSQSKEPKDRGGMCRRELQVDVYIHGPIGTISRKTAIDLVDQLDEALLETQFGRFIFDKTETVNGIYDHEDLRTKNLFLSFFRATYYDFN